MWDKSGAGRGRDFYLNTDEYDEIINAIDRDLQDRNVTGFLAGIYEKIQKEYVRKNFSQIVQENLGFYEYNRYVDEEARDKDEDPVDYADLGKSFFLNDIELMCELIRSGKFGDGNRYEKQVVAYILAGQEKSKGMGNIRRTIISPTEPAENIRRFFEKTLNVADAPMGKWPSKFMPALMQQVAVNIAIRKDDSAPVFSVNGPPGTGKTTLLKEIVASNIVDRAYLLAKAGRDPESRDETLLRILREKDRIWRAVTLRDYEQLAMETPGLCLHSCRAWTESRYPGTVHLVVRPGDGKKTSVLTERQKEAISAWLEDRRLIGTRLRLHTPRYIYVDTEVEVIPSPQYRDSADILEKEIRKWFREKETVYGEPLLYSELFGRLDALPCVRILRVLAMNPRTAGIRRNHNRDLIPPVSGVFLPGRIEVILNHYQVSER